MEPVHRVFKLFFGGNCAIQGGDGCNHSNAPLAERDITLDKRIIAGANSHCFALVGNGVS
jgi:hypothetical protein